MIIFFSSFFFPFIFFLFFFFSRAVSPYNGAVVVWPWLCKLGGVVPSCFTHFYWTRLWLVTESKAKMERVCWDFVVCTLTYTPTPRYGSRLPCWPHLMNIPREWSILTKVSLINTEWLPVPLSKAEAILFSVPRVRKIVNSSTSPSSRSRSTDVTWPQQQQKSSVLGIVGHVGILQVLSRMRFLPSENTGTREKPTGSGAAHPD